MSFNFKSVGKTKQVIKTESLTPQAPTPIGIKTPMALGDKTIVQVHYTVSDQVHDNLRNLLLTNWGERVGLYDFGANLRPLLSEYTSQEGFETEAIERIRNAVSKWMPFIDLETFSSTVDKSSRKTTFNVTISITYNIKSLNVVNKKLDVVLSAM